MLGFIGEVWLAIVLVMVAGSSRARCRNSTDRIVGGKFARPGDFPFAVGLVRGQLRCGGSIIDERHIVTAAHCVER